MCLCPTYIVNQGFVACGKCLECLQKKSVEWSYRIMLESKFHDDCCFITLTYNEDNLPEGASLKRKDLQKFLKRLRRKLEPKTIRFFYCGEYGSKLERPHYHIIIFGWKPNDLYFWCYDNKKTKLFRSPFLEKIWTFGFSSVGDLTIDSAKYCAKYMQKAIGDSSSLRARSFIGMSNKPGLAYNAIDRKMLDTGKIYYNGKYIKLPRYFLKVLERRLPFAYAEFKKKQKPFVLATYNDYYNFIDSLITRNKKFLKNFKKTELYFNNKHNFNNLIKDYQSKLKDLTNDENMRDYFDNVLSACKTDYMLNYPKEFFEKGLTFDFDL